MMTFSPISNEELLFLVVHQPMPFPRVVGLLVVGFTSTAAQKRVILFFFLANIWSLQPGGLAVRP